MDAVCELGTCDEPATHYAVILTAAEKRVRAELCRTHLQLGRRLADAKLCKIIEYGPLDKSWTVHPGGK